MTKKHRRSNNSEIDRIASRILAEDHRQHMLEKKQQWKHRLFKSLSVAIAAIITAHFFHIELMFKGAELIFAAAAHWLFFGMAD